MVYTDKIAMLDQVEIFDSDFESTDEDVAQEDEAVGEKQIIEEEKQIRRVCYMSATSWDTLFIISLHTGFTPACRSGGTTP